MMTRQEAIEFGKSSASMAVDQAGDDLQASIDSYRDNVRDTLKDERASQYEVEAWEAFDAEIARLTK